MKSKIILVKDCVSCPLSQIEIIEEPDLTSFVVCHSAKWVKPRKVGSFAEIIDKKIIPEWCPLEDAEDFIEGEYRESFKSLVETREGLASADFDRENAEKAGELAVRCFVKTERRSQGDSEKSYSVISLSKEDLSELFQDEPEVLDIIKRLSDAEMKQLACDVSDAIFANGYWSILEEVFRHRFFKQ